MHQYKLGVLNGDGIGPEIVKSTVDVITAAAARVGGSKLEYIPLPMGWEGITKYDAPVPEFTKAELKTCDGWLMGPHDSAAYPPNHLAKLNPSGELRHCFDLFSNVRPARFIPGCKSLVGEDVDLVIMRENTEGFYPDRNMYKGLGEFMPTPDMCIVSGLFTRRAAERIALEGFTLAMKRRKKVTIVHKANVIKMGYGLFRDTCREIGRQFPDVQVDDYHIDAMTAHLVRRAKDFDVIVTTNMFGDILSDLTGELTGSLGLSPSINTNNSQAMAQAAHGSAPDIAGKNISNPVGMLLSGVMLLEWMSGKHNDESLGKMARIAEQAILKTLADGVRTRDLGGTASTTDFTKAIVERIG
jgi:3-isopropylmalate dehydrogenase